MTALLGDLPIMRFRRYAAAGFVNRVLPILPPDAQLSPNSSVHPSQRGKIPGVFRPEGWSGLHNWTRGTFTASAIEAWDAFPSANIGIRTADCPACDLDLTSASALALLSQLLPKLLGPAPLRGRENSTRTLAVYRLKAGEPEIFKRRIAFRAPDSDDEQVIEFLGSGQQFVAEGVHKSGGRYVWKDGRDLVEIGFEGLTEITAEQWRAAQVAIAQELRAKGFEIISDGGTQGGGEFYEIGDAKLMVEGSPVHELISAVHAIPCEKLDYHQWITLLRAIKAACGGDERFYDEIVLPWCMRFKSNDPEVVRGKWESFQTSKLGADYVFGVARNYGWAIDASPFAAPVDGAAAPELEQAAEGVNNDLPIGSSIVALARRFNQQHGKECRYLTAYDQWYLWDGRCWRPDELQAMRNRVSRFCAVESTLAGRRGASVTEQKTIAGPAISQVMTEAQSHQGGRDDEPHRLAATVEDFDRNPWSLNTPIGIVNLCTGEVGASERAAFCSKITAVAPAATEECPRWHQFLAEITHGDPALQNYLQRLAGYALTGSTREQEFYILQGVGGSGKGTFVRQIAGCLGSYQITVAPETIIKTKNDKHPVGVAMLAGARLAQVHETPQGSKLDDNLVKDISGGDPLTARKLYGQPFTFTPRCKLWIFTNHKPRLDSVDSSIQRRLRLIPFNNPPAVVDKSLDEKLAAEWPGILRWAINGAVQWFAIGLGNVPAAVKDYTSEYFEEEERLHDFLEARCIIDPQAEVRSADIYREYAQWAREAGEFVKSQKLLVRELKAAGFLSVQMGPASRRVKGLRGLKLRSDFPETPP